MMWAAWTQSIKRIRGIAVLALPLFLAGCGESETGDAGAERYGGRYASGPYSLFTVDVADGYIAIVPPFWTSKPYLGQDAEQRFSQRIPHVDTDRTVRFILDDNGVVEALEARNYDVDVAEFERLAETEEIPIEQFLAGRIDAFNAFLRQDPSLDEDSAATLARQLLVSYPSRSGQIESAVRTLATRFPGSSMLSALHGYALLATSERELALDRFQNALRIDGANDLAEEAVRRLTMREPGDGDGYRARFPYDLDSLFVLPSEEEVARVRADWRSRDLRPDEVKVVHETELALSHATYAVRIVSHRVHGDLHFGAVLVPSSAERQKLPVIIESRGVDPRYTPVDISNGTQLMRALQAEQPRFVFVIPALRGETLILHDRSFTAEGDRSDSWDGATDDMISLLNVALELEPRADADRIAAYGKSRGGSVALLTGIRDTRIDLVMSLAGPVDWFVAMENRFFSTAETLRDQLRGGASLEPTQEGGQFYERFVAPVDRGEWTIADARHSMIAGSPLYFVEDLPKAVAFYGEEDRSVPVANALALGERMGELGRGADEFSLTIYSGRGHDTEPYLAFRKMVDALLTEFYP